MGGTHEGGRTGPGPKDSGARDPLRTGVGLDHRGDAFPSTQQKSRAQKRGGGRWVLSIDEEIAEKRFQNEPVDDLSPEKLFDREWALALLQDVCKRLESEYSQQGKKEVFDILGEYLIEKPEKGTYPALAEKLGVSPGNVRVMVTRIRKRYQDRLRETIAETVNSVEEVEEELQHLFASFTIS